LVAVLDWSQFVIFKGFTNKLELSFVTYMVSWCCNAPPSTMSSNQSRTTLTSTHTRVLARPRHFFLLTSFLGVCADCHLSREGAQGSHEVLQALRGTPVSFRLLFLLLLTFWNLIAKLPEFRVFMPTLLPTVVRMAPRPSIFVGALRPTVGNSVG
jgi:hypothetical protein